MEEKVKSPYFAVIAQIQALALRDNKNPGKNDCIVYELDNASCTRTYVVLGLHARSLT